MMLFVHALYLIWEWNKALHPDMKNERIVRPATITQTIFRTYTREMVINNSTNS